MRKPDFCICTAQFVSDLVRNPKDRFSHNEAQLEYVHTWIKGMLNFRFDLKKALKGMSEWLRLLLSHSLDHGMAVSLSLAVGTCETSQVLGVYGRVVFVGSPSFSQSIG